MKRNSEDEKVFALMTNYADFLITGNLYMRKKIVCKHDEETQASMAKFLKTLDFRDLPYLSHDVWELINRKEIEKMYTDINCNRRIEHDDRTEYLFHVPGMSKKDVTVKRVNNTFYIDAKRGKHYEFKTKLVLNTKYDTKHSNVIVKRGVIRLIVMKSPEYCVQPVMVS